MPEFEPIIGRFFSVGIDGAEHRIYVEEAGKGIPLLCLHTAGADSRQYRHLLNDTAVTDRFRVIAFDLPYHGRSTPPDRWWLKKYRLTTASYLEMIRAVWLTLGLERPVVMGCSMGGAIALKVAAEYQD
ncbi:MAG: alpha/beta fold hydrolase, partial [Pseudolabrys sp.]